MTQRATVLVLFGGRSGEHPISCITAAGVLREIDRTRFDVITVGITRAGHWVLLDDQLSDVVKDNSGLPFIQENGTEVLVPLSSTNSHFRVIENGQIRDLGHVDVVFPLIHGPFGEDGTLQGMFELADVRYVGAGVLASAAGMDKHYMKVVLQGHGIPVTPFVTVFPGEWENNRDSVISRVSSLDFPVFVKPARAGSSLGVSKVDSIEGLDAALAIAHKQDPKVLIETGIVGREIECAVLGGHFGEPARTSFPGEVTMESDAQDWYDFESKYIDNDAASLSCPADLSDEVAALVRKIAVDTFNAMGCEGLSRVDVFVEENGNVIVNEINTMPGFTPISMYPRMWERSGITYKDLVTELIDLALERPIGLR